LALLCFALFPSCSKKIDIYHPPQFSLAMNYNDTDTVQFYVSDVGGGKWEEISVGGTGYEKANYGWPYREGPCQRGRNKSIDCDVVDNDYVVVNDSSSSPEQQLQYTDPMYFYQHTNPNGSAIVGKLVVLSYII
jgi:hypothetical protein